MIRQNARPVVLALIAALLFGSAAPLSRLLLEGIGPLSLGVLIYIGTGSGMACCMGTCRVAGYARRTIESPVTRSDIPWLVASVLTGSLLSTVFLMFGLRLTPATTASLLLSFEAVATSLIAYSIFGEPVGRRFWLALILIVGGCFALSWNPDSVLGFSAGALGIIAATICWGFGNNFNRILSAKDPVSVVMV
ncbi:MAG: DMT family transporter [Methanoculleaceae archaeon]